MSSPIQSQAAKVWQLLTSSTTAATYGQAIQLTFTILKESLYLVWLGICLVLVLGDWIWSTGIKAGRSTRTWLDNFERPSTDRLLSEAGKAVLEVSKSGVNLAISNAKDQLGIPQPEPVEAAPVTPTPKATVSTPPPAAPITPVPAPPVAPPSTESDPSSEV